MDGMDLSHEFVDDYEHLDKDIEYILENILCEEVRNTVNECEESKQLVDLYNTLLLNKCECNVERLQQCSNCSHGANYTYDEENRELVLNDCEHIPHLIYECSHFCKCKTTKCRNRLAQYGPRICLKIIYFAKYGSKGLITTQDIPKGAFICEYAGELLTTREAKKILRANELEHKMNYVLFLRESCILPACATKHDTILTIVNPSKRGNIGRYLNHSCEPNSQIISVRIDSPIPKICFFAKRKIKAGEEICFCYNEGVKKMENKSNSNIPCLCGSKNCSKFLPNSEYT